MTIESNKNENSNSNINTLFNFEDDSDDAYELVLPPECEIKQSSIAGCSKDEQTMSLLYEESSEEKRVSFDMSKNEYLTVERYINNSGNSSFDADDEFQTGDELDINKFAIDLGTITEIQNLRISREAHSIEDEINNNKMRLEMLNKVENETANLDFSTGSSDLTGMQYNDIKIETNTFKNDNYNKYKDSNTTGYGTCNDMPANTTYKIQDESSDCSLLTNTIKNENTNYSNFDTNASNSKLDLFTEYISKIDIPEDRLVKILMNKEGELSKLDNRQLPSENERLKLEKDKLNLKNSFTNENISQDVATAPIVEVSKVIVENIRSLKDNPFILKDKSGKI